MFWRHVAAHKMKISGLWWKLRYRKFIINSRVSVVSISTFSFFAAVVTSLSRVKYDNLFIFVMQTRDVVDVNADDAEEIQSQGRKQRICRLHCVIIWRITLHGLATRSHLWMWLMMLSGFQTFHPNDIFIWRLSHAAKQLQLRMSFSRFRDFSELQQWNHLDDFLLSISEILRFSLVSFHSSTLLVAWMLSESDYEAYYE